ncbi:MAG: tetratricopeptide repeat protein [Alphaproteobacteria bacterium]
MIPDLSILTLPFLAAGGVFVLAMITGEDIALNRISVPWTLASRGFDEVVITRQLSDYMSEINAGAASELSSVTLEEGSLEKSIGAFEDFFEIQLLVTGMRNLLGMIPVYINGEVTEQGEDIVLTIRVYSKDENKPVHRVTARGKPQEIDSILRKAALDTLETINPYVVALYHRRIEMAAGAWDFPKTHEAVDHYLKDRPVEEHFLAYGLLGRMHMLKAERAPNLSDAERTAEYERAIELLNGALLQRPDFLFPNLNLAVIEANRGNYAAAEAYFKRAAVINPQYRTTRESWADMLLKQGRTTEGLAQLVAAVEIDKKNPALRNRLGQLYQQVGRPDLARVQFERALRLNPRNKDYLNSWRGTAAAR